jgi:photosystem II stability/assembly factor-like uncharacterized protein
MLRFFILLIFTVTIHASQSFLLKEGWNLLGSNYNNVSPRDYFYDAKLMWKYDNSKKTWSILSPNHTLDNEIEQELSTLNIGVFDTLNAGDGFWVYNDIDQTLNVNGNIPFDSNVTLSYGWNLISSKSFKDISTKDLINTSCIEAIWSYHDDQWYAYSAQETINESLQKANIPILDTISKDMGFWVLTGKDCQLDTDIKLLPLKTKFDSVCINKSIQIELQDLVEFDSYEWNTSTGELSSNKKQASYKAPSTVPELGTVKINLDTTLGTKHYHGAKELLIINPQNEQGWHKTMGPFGGRTNDIAVDASNHSVMYLAGNGGKIFKSVDGGKTWQIIYDFKMDAPIHNIVMGDSNTLYTFTDKLQVSHDGGSSFSEFEGIIDPSILIKDSSSRVIVGTHLSKVYEIQDNNLSNIKEYNLTSQGRVKAIASSGDIRYIITTLDSVSTTKLYKSIDNGQTFTEITNIPNNKSKTMPNSVYIDPSNPQNVYVGMLDNENEVFTQNDEKYLFKTTDGGATWQSLTLPWTDSSINLVGIHPHNHKMYVTSGSSLFSSSDDINWVNESPINRLLADSPKVWMDTNSDRIVFTAISGVVQGSDQNCTNYIEGIANVGVSLISVSDNKNIYASSPGGEGLFKSENYGYSWQSITANGITHPWMDELAVNPHNKDEIWAIADVGIGFISHNNGNSWSEEINSYHGSFRYGSIYAMDIAFDGSIYALKNGFGVFKSNTPSNWYEYDWTFLNDTQVDYSYTIKSDKNDANTLYVGSIPKPFQHNAFITKSTDAGESWTKILDINGSKGISSIDIDPTNSSILYSASVGDKGELYVSTNAGSNWDKLNETLNFSNFHFVSTSPANPDVAYGAAWGGGVYKTQDHGDSWQQMQNIPTFSAESIYEDPNNPDILYLSDRTAPIIYKSSDGGKRWSEYFHAPENYYRVLALTVSKSDNGVIYTSIFDKTSPFKGGLFRVENGVATLLDTGFDFNVLRIKTDNNNPNILYAITHSEGVYKSTDKGVTWSELSFNTPKIGFNNIVVDTNNSNILYLLGGSDVYFDNGIKHKGIANDKLLTVYKSQDGGETWTNMNVNSIIGNVKGLVSINSNILYITGAKGMAISRDAGINWSLIKDAPATQNFTSLSISSDKTALYVSSATGGIFKATLDTNYNISLWDSKSKTQLPIDHILVKVDPNNSNTLYATAYPGGNFKSEDAGLTWSEKNFGMPNFQVEDPTKQGYYALDIAQTDSKTLFLGLFGRGVYKSTDGGDTWLPSNGVDRILSNAKIFDIKIDPSNALHVVTSSTKGVYETTDGGLNWHEFNTGIERTQVKLLRFTQNGELFAGTLGNEMYKYEKNENRWYQLNGFGQFGNYWSMWDRPLYQYTTIAFDPTDVNTMFIGTFPSGIYKTTDRGFTWKESNIGWSNDGVFSFKFHPDNPNILYSGTYNGINRSLDKGEHWSMLDNGWPSEQWIFSIDFDHNNSDIMYACSKNGQNLGRGVEEFHGTVMKSTDGGEHWFEITNGLNKDQEFYKIITDKFDSNILYLATQHEGIFISLDAGVSWKPWNEGLEGEVAGTNGNNVTDVLKISQDGLHLFFGTAASGVYRRLTYKALEQLGCQIIE